MQDLFLFLQLKGNILNNIILSKIDTKNHFLYTRGIFKKKKIRLYFKRRWFDEELIYNSIIKYKTRQNVQYNPWSNFENEKLSWWRIFTENFTVFSLFINWKVRQIRKNKLSGRISLREKYIWSIQTLFVTKIWSNKFPLVVFGLRTQLSLTSPIKRKTYPLLYTNFLFH